MNQLDSAQNIFIQGIKGVGMANLALILQKMGKHVIGSDIKEEFITDEMLATHNIGVITNFIPSSLPENIHLYIYSAAHQGLQNPQAEEAKKRGIPIVAQTVVLGEVMQKFENAIAISGCHGKTTSSALLAYALEKLGVDPSYFIGTSTLQDNAGIEADEYKYFVVEADEYGVNPPLDKTPKFFALRPTHTVCLNIDFDHPDVYEDLEATKQAFLRFLTKTPQAKLYLNIDNVNLTDIIKTIPQDSCTTFGFDGAADYQIKNPIIEEFFSQFELISKRDGRNLGVFQIALFGMQNISNAAGVITLLISLGFDVEEIKKAIANFSGVKRRFEKIAEENGILLIDDYAHHPEEIVQTIASARARFTDRRIGVIFQPHTYSRTSALKYDFVDTLATADYVILAPIYASARENQADFPISSEELVKLARDKGIHKIYSSPDKQDLLQKLRHEVQRGDVLFTMGAGDVYKMKNDIIEVIKTL